MEEEDRSDVGSDCLLLAYIASPDRRTIPRTAHNNVPNILRSEIAIVCTDMSRSSQQLSRFSQKREMRRDLKVQMTTMSEQSDGPTEEKPNAPDGKNLCQRHSRCILLHLHLRGQNGAGGNGRGLEPAHQPTKQQRDTSPHTNSHALGRLVPRNPTVNIRHGHAPALREEAEAGWNKVESKRNGKRGEPLVLG